jgi:Fe-S cluster assembly protein SufD
MAATVVSGRASGRSGSRVLEPAWVGTLRAAAQARFGDMAWPATSEEEWRRTDVSRLSLDSFVPAAASRPACPQDIEPGAWAGVIRFEGTRCSELGVSASAAARGVRLLPMDLAAEELEAPLHRGMEEAMARADNRFVAWHYAAMSHGAVLWVPPGVELTEPVLIEFLERADGAEGDKTVTTPHVEILLGTGARAEVIQRVAGRDGGGQLLCNAVTRMDLADNAHLRWNELQTLPAAALYVRNASAHVARDASLTVFDAQLGARFVRTRLESDMAGPGADASLNGVYFGREGQHMDMRTVQNHVAPKASSRAYYKGAVATGGRTIFQGLIEVAQGAAGTDAFLTNRNLVLGDAARSDSIPTLRIANNDVKCSHGSTTGKLNPDQLFYLQSRGLSAVDAKEMLVIGYFEDLLGPAAESVRNDALAVIRERLRGAA